MTIKNKYEIFEYAYYNSAKTQNINAYSISLKLEKYIDSLKIENNKVKIYLKILFEKCIFKDTNQVEPSIKIFLFFNKLYREGKQLAIEKDIKKIIQSHIKLHFY